MDPVLVLGGCGGLGYHIIKQLPDTGKVFDVTSFDIQTDVNRVQGDKYIRGGITSENDVRSVLEAVQPRPPFILCPRNLWTKRIRMSYIRMLT